jgi:hypothetical protein
MCVQDHPISLIKLWFNEMFSFQEDEAFFYALPFGYM